MALDGQPIDSSRKVDDTLVFWNPSIKKWGAALLKMITERVIDDIALVISIGLDEVIALFHSNTLIKACAD